MLHFDYEDALDAFSHANAAGNEAPGWTLRYPATVRTAIGMGALAWPLAVQRALYYGIRDLNKLTDLAFFMHFPELNGAPVQKGDPKIASYRQVWTFLRNGIVGILSTGTPTPRTPAKSAKTLDHYLDRIEDRVAQHKRCVLQKLLDPQASLRYLPARGVTAFLSTSPQHRGIGEHRRFYTDMRQQLDRLLERFNDVPTTESIEARLKRAFDSNYLELFNGIRALKYADCYDKRTPAMRRDIFNQRNDPNSLYHCPTLRRMVAMVMSDLAGFDRVKPEYGCAA